MKREILIMFLLFTLVGMGCYIIGLRRGRVDVKETACGPSEPAPPAPASPPAPPEEPPEGCEQRRLREEMNYLVWRGKHIQQLEACTKSLGEATHALARRAP